MLNPCTLLVWMFDLFLTVALLVASSSSGRHEAGILTNSVGWIHSWICNGSWLVSISHLINTTPHVMFVCYLSKTCLEGKGELKGFILCGSSNALFCFRTLHLCDHLHYDVVVKEFDYCTQETLAIVWNTMHPALVCMCLIMVAFIGRSHLLLTVMDTTKCWTMEYTRCL